MPLKTLAENQQYDIPLNRINGSKFTNYEFDDRFIKFAKISENVKIEIIKLGFKLSREGKISLKKFY